MRSLLAAGLGLLSLTAFVNADEPSAMGEPVVYLVLFDSNNADLTNTATAVLDEAVREYWMRTQTFREPVTIYVTGHYDASGTAGYAEQMSRRMAETVRDYLIARSLPVEAVKVSWSGERQLAIPTPDGVAESANRRVEINFSFPPN
jgi:OOP family OmpA-OmpF porin